MFGIALVLKFMKKYFPCVYKVSFMPVIDPVSNTVGNILYFSILSHLYTDLCLSPCFVAMQDAVREEEKDFFSSCFPLGAA